MDQDVFIKNLYIRSLTPFELLDFCKKYKCTFEITDRFKYLYLWKFSVNKDCSNSIFEDYKQFHNLSTHDASLMVSSIKDTYEEISFPSWVKTLQDSLNSINISSYQNIDKNNEKPFYHIFLPFLNSYQLKLTQRLKKRGLALPSLKLLSQLKDALYNHLFQTSETVLLNEFSNFKRKQGLNNKNDITPDFYYIKFVQQIISNRFQDLFCSYPMLARKIALKLDNYLEFSTNIFIRFYSDKTEIENLFEKKLDTIIALHLNAGDSHNGETTVIIEFNNNYKIVYKPSNISITNAYNRFLDWVNYKLNDNLKSFNVIDKSEYGWLEFVEHYECENLNDVKLYYERAGIIAGIAYFLNARDYHFENIIASGNCPVLIDHETSISSTPIRIDKNETQKTQETQTQTIIGTILESFLLPIKNISAPTYACGFGSSHLLEHEIVIAKFENTNLDSMMKTSEKQTKKLYQVNKPVFDNQIYHLKDYHLQFKNGFKKLYDIILQNKEFLLSDSSPLLSFENKQIRFIYRTTKVYHKILKAINNPQNFKDAIVYGVKLEILARAYAANNNWSHLLTSERRQMLNEDIPVFYVNSTSKTLELGNKKRLDIFKLNALEGIYSKINNANENDYDTQLNLINEAVLL